MSQAWGTGQAPGAAELHTPSWMMLPEWGAVLGHPSMPYACRPVGFPQELLWQPALHPWCKSVKTQGATRPSSPPTGQERAKAGQGDAVSVPARDVDAGPCDGDHPVGSVHRKELPVLGQPQGHGARRGTLDIQQAGLDPGV